MKWLKVFVPVLVLSMMLVACGGGPKSMDLSPNSAKFDQKGQTATFAVAFKDQAGKTVESKDTLTWTSSDEKVAIVANGTVTAVDTGVATITATAGELTVEAKVTVQIPGSISINPKSITLPIGDTKGLKAAVLDTAGKEIPGKDIAWNSASNNIATVSNGKVTGINDGETAVTASWGGMSASANVTVVKAMEAKGIEKKEPKEAKKAKGIEKKDKKDGKKDKKDGKKDKKDGKKGKKDK